MSLIKAVPKVWQQFYEWAKITSIPEGYKALVVNWTPGGDMMGGGGVSDETSNDIATLKEELTRMQMRSASIYLLQGLRLAANVKAQNITFRRGL